MAIRYLCPICDHELVARGYCASCKKFIKEPIEYKGAYLPNEDRGNYTLNRSMPESQKRNVVNPRYQSNPKRGNSSPYTTRTYTTRTNTTSSGRINADYGNCGGHRDSDYGKPNVDPHAPKKKKKGVFKYVALIYIIIIIIKAILDSIN